MTFDVQRGNKYRRLVRSCIMGSFSVCTLNKILSGEMNREECKACLGKVRIHAQFLSGILRIRVHLQDLGLLKLIKEVGWEVWTGFVSSEQGPAAGCCEHGYISSGSRKGGRGNF